MRGTFIILISHKKIEPLPIKVNNLSNSDNKLSPIYSNTKTSLRCSTKTQYVPNKYNTITYHLTMSTLV